MMLFVDTRGIDASLRSGLELLARQPFVTSTPDLATAVSEMTLRYADGQTQISTYLGLNPFTDLTSVGICGKLGSSPTGLPSPEFIAVIQGSFGTAPTEQLAEILEFAPMQLGDGAAVYGVQEDGVTIGMSAPIDGVILLGTEAYLTPLASEMPTMALPEGVPEDSLLTRLSELVPHGVTSFFAMAPSISTRFLLGTEGPVSFSQLVAGLDSMYMLANSDVSFVEVHATDAIAHERYALILGGLGDLFTAAPYVAGGVLQFVFGVLSPDDPDLEAPLRLFLSHREDVFALANDLGLTNTPHVEFNRHDDRFVSDLSMNNAASLQATGAAVLMGGWLMFMRAEAPIETHMHEH